MNPRYLVTVLAITAVSASAQTRRATMNGGGAPDRGKCTIEVVVDGAAEVEIRGDTANLRNLRGQPPQWRRFECNGVMPANPADFRFAGVDGRGSQRLVRDPRQGGAAVVQIEDPDNGSEGYTFDIFWGGGNLSSGRNQPDIRGGQYDRGNDRYDRDDRAYDRDRGGPRGRFSQDDAVRSCQDAVRQQVSQRFDPRSVVFRRVQTDDNPGRRDTVAGVFDVRRGNGRDEAYRFSCSVDFNSGRVWNAQVTSLRDDRDRDRFDNDRDRNDPRR
jgi:hypothetical protein